MAQKILIKKSTVAGRVPVAADLQIGELAVNTADRRLYSKHSDDAIVAIGSAGMQPVPATSTSTGTAGQMACDGTHLYLCTAADSWKRVALAGW